MEARCSHFLAITVLIASSIFTLRIEALVNPEFTQTANTDWLAFVYIRYEPTDDILPVCSGVLIDPYWVLSSRGCLVDPYEFIEFVSTQHKLTYFIELWGQFELFEVVKSIPSPDGRLVMHKLNKPATVNPIARSLLTAQELPATKVEVPGYFVSESLGNPEFNPDGDTKVRCRVSGELFRSNNNYCYILTPEYTNFFISGIFGTVVDPQVTGPLTSPLDDELTLELLENELFIDFEEGSYPCYEDIGSPVVISVNGEARLIGIVTGVGIVSGLPICTNSYRNTYSALSYYEDYVRQTLLRDAFDSGCPTTTTLRMEVQEYNSIRLYWEPQQSATGYQILYTDRLGYNPLQKVDVGNVTEVSTPVNPAITYSVALIAYNKSCTSQPSDPVTILIDKP